MIGSFLLLAMSTLDRTWVKDPGHSSSCDVVLNALGSPLSLMQLLQSFWHSHAVTEYLDKDEPINPLIYTFVSWRKRLLKSHLTTKQPQACIRLSMTPNSSQCKAIPALPAMISDK